MSTLTFRPARPTDVDVAVPVLHSSMGGLADYLYSGDPRHPVDAYLARMFQMAGHRFSWDVSFIAEVDGRAVGMLLSYPGRDINRLQFAFLLNLPHLYGWIGALRVLWRVIPLTNAPETDTDEYYVSNIGILPEFQSRGYGAELMALAEQKTREAGLPKCALAVDEENHGAIRFYERLGYKIIYSKTFTGNMARHESGYHRLAKLLTNN
jgi:ribosomal protein S18 acetylase RimI-like enzyme